MNFNNLEMSEQELVEYNLERDKDTVNERIWKARNFFREAKSLENWKEQGEKYFLASVYYYDAINFLNDNTFYSREKLRKHFHKDYFDWLKEWSEVIKKDQNNSKYYRDYVIKLCKWVVEMCKTKKGEDPQKYDELSINFNNILTGLWYEDDSKKTPEEKLWDKIDFKIRSAESRLKEPEYPSDMKNLRACKEYKEVLDIFENNPELKKNRDKYFNVLWKWSEILITWESDWQIRNEYQSYATKIYKKAIEICKKTTENSEKYGEYLSLFEKTVDVLSTSAKTGNTGNTEAQIAEALYWGNYSKPF